VPGASRHAQIRSALTPAEWRQAGLLALVVAGLHVAGFVLLLGVVVPQHLLGLGVGITAYTLGLRHAFDAETTSRRSTTRRASS